MWILTDNVRAAGTVHRLLGDRVLVVGRKSEIRLDNDDKSISRQHAVIVVSLPKSNGAGAGDGDERGYVTVRDTSKYGTFVKEQRLEKEVDTRLSEGDVVRFGLQWNSWTLRWQPLVFVGSLLAKEQRQQLLSLAVEMGARVSNVWPASIDPNVSWLVMSSFRLSVKAITALVSGVSIVLPSFFVALRDALAVCASAPDPDQKNHAPLPPADEHVLRNREYSLQPDARRRQLFVGRRYVFVSRQQHATLCHTVRLAGGTALLLQPDDEISSDSGGARLSDDQLCQPDVIVVNASSGGGGDRTSQLSVSHQRLTQLRDALRRRKRRFVHEQELGLALLSVSMAQECNPQFDYAAACLLPAVVETQSQTHTHQSKKCGRSSSKGTTSAVSGGTATLGTGGDSVRILAQDTQSPFAATVVSSGQTAVTNTSTSSLLSQMIVPATPDSNNNSRVDGDSCTGTPTGRPVVGCKRRRHADSEEDCSESTSKRAAAGQSSVVDNIWADKSTVHLRDTSAGSHTASDDITASKCPDDTIFKRPSSSAGVSSRTVQGTDGDTANSQLELFARFAQLTNSSGGIISGDKMKQLVFRDASRSVSRLPSQSSPVVCTSSSTVASSPAITGSVGKSSSNRRPSAVTKTGANTPAENMLNHLSKAGDNLKGRSRSDVSHREMNITGTVDQMESSALNTAGTTIENPSADISGDHKQKSKSISSTGWLIKSRVKSEFSSSCNASVSHEPLDMDSCEESEDEYDEVIDIFFNNAGCGTSSNRAGKKAFGLKKDKTKDDDAVKTESKMSGRMMLSLSSLVCRSNITTDEVKDEPACERNDGSLSSLGPDFSDLRVSTENVESKRNFKLFRRKHNPTSFPRMIGAKDLFVDDGRSHCGGTSVVSSMLRGVHHEDDDDEEEEDQRRRRHISVLEGIDRR